jgi:alpha-mannosidase
MVVFNPLPWRVKQCVEAAAIVGRRLSDRLYVVDAKGKRVPCQAVTGQRIGHINYAFTADVPALGYRCYHARSGATKVKGACALAAGARDGGGYWMENAWWRIEFDPYTGEMCRLHDKKAKTETLRRGNVLACMVDQSDTWSHGYDEWRVEAGRFTAERLELYEPGDVRATIRVLQRFRASTAEQFVTIYRDTDAIDCMFRINWQEHYTMLKLAYETTIEPGTATYDTAYGCQERNTDGFEEPGQKWIDLTGTVGNRKYGFAILNDSKYGFDVRDGILRVTMLRSPAYAHHDRGRYDSSEPWAVMDQGWHTVRVRLVPHTGSWEGADVVRKAWELNEPVIVHIESAHKGKLPSQMSYLESGADNVILAVLKKSEDGDAIVVRGYETAGQRTKAAIRLPFVKQPIGTVFSPHEIKTLRIDRESGSAIEVDLLEEPME